MEFFERYRCVEYGTQANGMLYLCWYEGGFALEDTPENREYIKNEFNNWKNCTNDFSCGKCQYKKDCYKW